jgi:ubiquitin-protein ligase E3 D
MPSIVYVQKSCLMTLNNLLSTQAKWNPILPERRHSMPSTQAVPQPDTSALQTLLSNVRNRNSSDQPTEIDPSLSNTELIDELRSRVDSLAASLSPRDAHLARALVSLLSHFSSLSVIQSSSKDPQAGPSSPTELSPSADVFDVLKRQLSDLQVERKSKADRVSAGSPPVLTVEIALLWSKIDEELEMVLSLCKERTEGLPRLSMDHQPPQYDLADYEYDDTPPEYEHASIESSDTKGRHSFGISPTSPTEKMRLDLEAVTMAIDRLYLVAPQLHNQRVELKTAKVEEMEKARRAGAGVRGQASAVSEGKRRERDVEELEGILDMIGKASDRKMTDQSVVLDGGMKARMERVRERDIARVRVLRSVLNSYLHFRQRDAFVEQLANHSNAGRLHAQDAILQPPKIKDLDAPMTLPEFLRESMAECQRKTAHSEALLSLPEFFKEPVPDYITTKPPNVVRVKKKSRTRSMSAPSLSWLRPSSAKGLGSRSRLNEEEPSTNCELLRMFLVQRADAHFNIASLAVHYVAEHHENLNHVLVFLTVADLTPDADVKAEVVSSLANCGEGDQFIVHSGSNTSLALDLPAPTSPGQAEVKVQRGHFELKLSTLSTDPPTNPIPLLDASQLSASKPTSFICASCSLPLVQSSKINSYGDLPSEHWEELVDAWMCHADQSLHERVAKHGKGFWPEAGQALIGGSYILFEESSVVTTNLYPAEQPKVSQPNHFIILFPLRTIKKTDVGYPPTVARLQG